MPLVSLTLKTALESKLEQKSEQAFKKAMEKFKEVSEGQNSASEPMNVFNDAVSQASTIFGDELKKLSMDVATEIDKYIKSATITLQPGIPTVIAGPLGPLPGTTLVSPPAIIS